MNEVSALKVPPHSTEAEAVLLAAMIQDNRLIGEIEHLTPEDFYRHQHQVVYCHLLAFSRSGKPVDVVLLANDLDAAGELEKIGGADFLIDLMGAARGSHNAHSYAEIIRNKSLARQMIRIGYQIADMGYNAEGSPDVDAAQGLALGLTVETDSDPEIIRSVLRRTVEDIDRRFQSKGQLIGQPTGFSDLDRLTAGFQDGQAIVVAGRPGMGKTTFAMNIVENLALQNKFCLIFNLEMTKQNLVMKSLSSLGRIPYSLLRAGRIEDHTEALTAAASRIIDKQVYIDDCASLTSQQILSRARKISQKQGRKFDLIVVDYLQLLNDKGEGHDRVTRMSRAMKIAAKELGCPIIVLSQLNRSLEQRPNKRPIMSDLRESGAVEQDADIIIMLYRDEVYNENTQHKGVAEAIIRKNREGETGTAYLKSRLDICRFENMDSPYSPPPETSKSGGRFEYNE